MSFIFPLTFVIYLLALDLVCSSFTSFFFLGCRVNNFDMRSFFCLFVNVSIYTINFLSDTAFTGSHKFWHIVLLLSLLF